MISSLQPWLRCRPRLRIALPVALLCAWAGSTAQAATEAPPPILTTNERLKALSFEELLEVQVGRVYAASKRDQPIQDAPASVSIVTAEDIQRYGYRTLGEALQGIQGLYVSSDRSYSYLGVRGISRPGDYGGRTLILINGHRLNDPIYQSAAVGRDFPLDLDLVDRIEVVRGPGYSLHGDNAFLAVINVIPKSGASLQGGEVSTSVASYDSYSGRISYGTRTARGVEWLLSGTLYDSEGHDRLYYPDFESTHGGVSEGLDGERSRQVFSSLSYQAFSLTAFLGERRKEVPTAQYEAVFNQGPNFVEDLRWGADFRFEQELGDDWHVLARTYLDGYRFQGQGPYSVEDPSQPEAWVINEDLAHTWFWGTEAEVDRTFADLHHLAAGLSYRGEPEIHQRNQDLFDPPEVAVDARSSADRFGAYLHDDFQLRTNLTLTAAVRLDYFSTFGVTVNPKAGIVYRPVNPTTLKLLYAQAFNSPNAYQRDYTIPGYDGNPDLRPERNRSYEGIWEQRYGGPWHSSVSVFYHDLTDFIAPVLNDDGDYTFANVDSMHSRGVEAGLEGRWPSGWRTRLAYTFAEATEQRLGSDRKRPANSPRHLAKAAFTLPVVPDRLFGSLEILGSSARLSPAGDLVPGYVLANVTLFSHDLFVRNLQFSVGIYNLLDRHYFHPVTSDFTQPSIEQDGRTFRVKLTYRF